MALKAAVPRWIKVGEDVREPLGLARQVSPVGSHNLVAPHESYQNLLQEIIRAARDILHAHDLKGFNELRAAYASERYEQITQHRAPTNRGQCYELGHGRIDVVAA